MYDAGGAICDFMLCDIGGGWSNSYSASSGYGDRGSELDGLVGAFVCPVGSLEV